MLSLLSLLACGTSPDTGPLDTASTCPTLEEAGAPATREPVATNLLVLSIDTLRRSAIGRFGGGADTPWLDARLDEGWVAEDHRVCASWTLPSLLCQLSGISPLEASFFPALAAGEISGEVPPDLRTLESHLRESGRITAWLTANYLLEEAVPDLQVPDSMSTRVYQPAAALADEALELAAALDQGPEPWSLFVHFIDPHTPYSPPPSYLEGLAELEEAPVDLVDVEVLRAIAEGESGLDAEALALVEEHLRVRYAGEVRFLDHELGRLWAELEAGGLLEDTLVVFTSDHGEQFFEHGGFTHARSLHTEEVAAVLAVWWPGVTPGAWTGPRSGVDLAATVLHYLGLDVPETWSGVPLGYGGDTRFRHAFYERSDGLLEHVAERDGWRLFYGWDGQRALYDVRTDPGEHQDLYDDRPEEVSCLWQGLDPWVDLAEGIFEDAEPVGRGP